MISGIQKISVYDPATGTVVQLNNVVADGEAKIASPLSYLDVDGKNKYDGDESYLSFGAYDDGGFAQLETWMKAKTPVRIVTAGFEENILWYDSAPILVKKNHSFAVGNRNYFSVQISKEGGSHNIKSVANLMLANAKWYDANTNGIADLFTKSGTFTTSFSNSLLQQTSSLNIGQSGYLINTFEYPIANLNLYYRLNRANTPSELFYSTGFGFRTFANVEISYGYGESQDGIISPTNTYSIQQSINLGSPSDGPQSLICNLPFLGMNRNLFTNINY